MAISVSLRPTAAKALTQLRDGLGKFPSLPRNDQLHLIGIALLLLCLALAALGFPRLDGVSWRMLFSISTITVAAALLFDGEAIYQRVTSSAMGQGALLLLAAAGGAIALGLASQIVNQALGVEPGHFTSTITLVGVLLVPLLFFALTAAAYFVVLVGGGLFLPFLLLPRFRSKSEDGSIIFSGRRWLIVARVVSAIILYAFAQTAFNIAGPGYAVWLVDVAKQSAFTLEMYERSSCATQPGERVAHLEENQVLIGRATEAGFTFLVGTCASGANSSP
jgi:hypothetical protein